MNTFYFICMIYKIGKNKCINQFYSKFKNIILIKLVSKMLFSKSITCFPEVLFYMYSYIIICILHSFIFEILLKLWSIDV